MCGMVDEIMGYHESGQVYRSSDHRFLASDKRSFWDIGKQHCD